MDGAVSMPEMPKTTFLGAAGLIKKPGFLKCVRTSQSQEIKTIKNRQNGDGNTGAGAVSKDSTQRSGNNVCHDVHSCVSLLSAKKYPASQAARRVCGEPLSGILYLWKDTTDRVSCQPENQELPFAIFVADAFF